MRCNLESSVGAAGIWSEQRIGSGFKNPTASTGVSQGADRHALALAIQFVVRQRLLEIELNQTDEQILPVGLHFNYYATALESTPRGRRHCFELVLSCAEGIVREVRVFQVDIGPSGGITVLPEDLTARSRFYRIEILVAFCRNVQLDLNRGCRSSETHELVL